MGTKRKIDDDAVARFLGGGGEIKILQFGSEKELKKAATRFRHADKAWAGSEHSKKILEMEKKNDESFIFSREERWLDEG